MVAAAPVAPALASSYTSGTGPASFGVGVGPAVAPAFATNPGTTGSAGIIGGSYSLPAGTMHALAAPAAPAANPYQQYIDAFNSSLQSSRAGVDRALHQSLGELAGRRDAAAQVVAQLPGQVASNYNLASGGLQSNADAATGALSPDVRGTAAALAAPLQGALAQDKAGAMSEQPFLNLAERANYDSGQAQLENSAFQANAGLDSQQRDFMLQQAQAQAQHQQQLGDQQLQWAHDKAWATDPSNPESLVGRQTLASQQNAAAVNAQPSGEAALQGTGLTTGEVTQLRASPEYARFTQMISAAKTDKHAGNGAMISNELATRNPKLLALLAKENPEFFANSKLPGAANPNAGFAASNDLHGTLLGHALGFGGKS